MKEIFYLDNNGEAQCKRIYRNKDEQNRIEKEERNYSKQRANEYWSSLTDAQRVIIKWCRENEKAQKECLGMAQVRERKLDEFYRLMNNTNITPKKIEKYDFVYSRFDDFKRYVCDGKI